MMPLPPKMPDAAEITAQLDEQVAWLSLKERRAAEEFLKGLSDNDANKTRQLLKIAARAKRRRAYADVMTLIILIGAAVILARGAYLLLAAAWGYFGGALP